jgi:peptidoglycan/LPS O-acetylase OafA/YrhL
VLLRWYHLPWFLPRLMFDPLCLEFGLGCLLFFGQERLGARTYWVLLGAAVVLFNTLVPRFTYLCGVPYHTPATVMSGADYAQSWQRVFFWGVPSAILAAAFLGLERHGRFTFPRSLVALGDASYSLYLIQSITVEPVQWLTRLSHTTNPWIPAVLFAVLTVGLSIVCWRWVELPLTHLARRWLGIKPRESQAGEPTLEPARA